MNAQPVPLRPEPAALARRNVTAVVRVCIAKAVAKVDARRDELTILRERWPDDSTAPPILRAASPPMSLTTTPALATSIVSDCPPSGPTGQIELIA
jgi:hypothetical protein